MSDSIPQYKVNFEDLLSIEDHWVCIIAWLLGGSCWTNLIDLRFQISDNNWNAVKEKFPV